MCRWITGRLVGGEKKGKKIQLVISTLQTFLESGYNKEYLIINIRLMSGLRNGKLKPGMVIESPFISMFSLMATKLKALPFLPFFVSFYRFPLIIHKIKLSAPIRFPLVTIWLVRPQQFHNLEVITPKSPTILYFFSSPLPVGLFKHLLSDLRLH